DLVVAYLPLLPVRLVQLLQELEIRIVEVPADEFETMGPNVLALAPRVGLALEGNPETRRRLERAGVDVSVYRGDEISRNGDGGPAATRVPGAMCCSTHRCATIRVSVRVSSFVSRIDHVRGTTNSSSVTGASERMRPASAPRAGTSGRT